MVSPASQIVDNDTIIIEVFKKSKFTRALDTYIGYNDGCRRYTG